MDTFAIPVIDRKPKTNSGTRVLLPLEDLLYLRVIGKHVHFFAMHRREYSLQAALADWRILLDGFDFEEVDRGGLVNTRNISFIYSDLHQIHFGAAAEGQFCPIARDHIARIKRKYPHIVICESGNLY